MRNIKNIIAPVMFGALAIGSTAVAQTPATPAERKAEAPKKAVAPQELGVGSVAPSLKDVKWLKGDAVNALNEEGKTYIIECWATWCGPCIAVIPHMNEFHNKFADKGLVIIGMNVFEDDQEKVKKFVADQGDKMGYRVAYSGTKSAFDTNWLKAGNVKRIPTAFVVKSGKIIFKGHPSQLSEGTIAKIVSANFDTKKFVAEQEAAAKVEKEFMGLMKKQDWKGAKEVANNIKDTSPRTAGLHNYLNSRLNDWDAQTALAKDILADKYEGADLKKIFSNTMLSAEVNEQSTVFAKMLVANINEKEIIEGKGVQSLIQLASLARTHFIAGDKEKATELLNKSILKSKDFEKMRGLGQFLKKLNERAASLKKDGTFPAL